MLYLGVAGVVTSGGRGKPWQLQVINSRLPGGWGKVKVHIWPGGEVSEKLHHLTVLSQHCDRRPLRIALLREEYLGWGRGGRGRRGVRGGMEGGRGEGRYGGREG